MVQWYIVILSVVAKGVVSGHQQSQEVESQHNGLP